MIVGTGWYVRFFVCLFFLIFFDDFNINSDDFGGILCGSSPFF
jgi:hypothetical protein